MSAEYDTEIRAVKRKLANARRELIRAVEQMAKIDPLPGHLAEAKRLTKAVRDAADEAVRCFEGKEL